MKLEYTYWYFKSALSKKFCNEVIKFAKKQKPKTAGIFSVNTNKKLTKKDKNNLKKHRDSNIVWLNEPWIYNEIIPFIKSANVSSNWNFDFDVAENCQFTIYNKNQYYHWHQDSYSKPYDCPENVSLHGKIRKLSVTCSLSDSSDYQGGELQFLKNNEINFKENDVIECNEIKEQGSIVVFPSFVYHRVTPIIKGTRYSLVIWFLGKPFK